MAFYSTKDQKVVMLSAKAFNGYASAGVWTMTKASDMWHLLKTAGDNAPVFEVPITDFLPQDALKGATLDKVVIHYNVTAANITTTAAEFHTITYNATTNAPAATTVAATGTLPKTAGATYAVTLTPASTITLDQDTMVGLEVTLSGAATTVIKIYGLDVYYTPAGE